MLSVFPWWDAWPDSPSQGKVTAQAESPDFGGRWRRSGGQCQIDVKTGSAQWVSVKLGQGVAKCLILRGPHGRGERRLSGRGGGARGARWCDMVREGEEVKGLVRGPFWEFRLASGLPGAAFTRQRSVVRPH